MACCLPIYSGWAHKDVCVQGGSFSAGGGQRDGRPVAGHSAHGPDGCFLGCERRLQLRQGHLAVEPGGSVWHLRCSSVFRSMGVGLRRVACSRSKPQKSGRVTDELRETPERQCAGRLWDAEHCLCRSWHGWRSSSHERELHWLRPLRVRTMVVLSSVPASFLLSL